ncbi:MAG: ABC transporter ATP-binding protein, partial [Deltaproteobacteria bacterium]
ANLQLQKAVAVLQRVSALFDIVPEENMDTGKKVKHLTGEIEFKNVSFSYDDREPVLRDVSFRIRPRERVAIVGPSGVGKTTLLTLILRYGNPKAIDEQVVRAAKVASICVGQQDGRVNLQIAPYPREE